MCKLWQRANAVPPPPFIPIKGSRVLLVDLGFQGSLTRLCLAQADITHTAGKGSLSNRLPDPVVNNGAVQAHELAQRVSTVILKQGTCDILGADDSLAEAELKAQARWLVSQEPDACYLFREAFHCKQFLGHYDWGFFGCPRG